MTQPSTSKPIKPDLKLERSLHKRVRHLVQEFDSTESVAMARQEG